MTQSPAHALISELSTLDHGLSGGDFLQTWDHPEEALRAVMLAARALRALRDAGLSTRVFDSGLAVSNFRDHSTRTRFSFASAANLLGLAVQDLDETKSQLAHGETVRETANMISFLTEVIGIRDDMFLGTGHAYMKDVSAAVRAGFDEGVLPQRPPVVNLQCDRDHPTQSMSDLLHLTAHFGSLEALRGKRIAMTWAYSPSYGKPLSVAQGIVGLLSRFGVDLVLGYPEGYELIPEIEAQAAQHAQASGGSFRVTHSMADAFEGADVVYPKSWAPQGILQQRTALLGANAPGELKDLERRCLAQNAEHTDWECTAEQMARTRDGAALYMHCLPADITGVSCERGEVAADVFEQHRVATYREASHKPYVIAAMILLTRLPDAAATLAALEAQATPRVLAGGPTTAATR